MSAEMRLAGWAVIVGELVALLWLGWLYSRHDIVISIDKGADVATLVLTAAAVVVTGVGVVVAVVTIWGFREIRDRAIDAAVAAALKAVQELVRDTLDKGRGSPRKDDATGIAKALTTVDDEESSDGN